MSLLRREFDIFLTAFMFFTRIPVPAFLNYTYLPDYLQLSSRYFPLVGLIVGGCGGLAFWLAALIFPLPLAVLFSMATTILVTGAFHEDGFADVCDGFGGGYTQAKVLEIMKDSRLGTYGSVGLMLILVAKGLALVELGAALVPVMLLVAHPLSRFAATTLIYFQNYARANEDSKAKPLATRISLGSFLLAAAFGLMPLLLLPMVTWLSLLSIGGITAILSLWFQRRIGGYTGDCLGAVQQVAEVTFYLTAVALL